MTPDIAIRPERADHPQVVALLGALDAYLATLYEPEANHILSVAELLAPEVSFFAAWWGDRVVGTGAVRRVAGAAGAAGAGHLPYGEVKRMYVEPSLRGQRVAARLAGVLEDSLRNQGITLAMLETGRDQHAALRLYQRCGYTRRAAFGGYPDNGLSLFFEKRL